MGFAKPIEQYLFGNLLTKMHVFMYLKDIIRGDVIMSKELREIIEKLVSENPDIEQISACWDPDICNGTIWVKIPAICNPENKDRYNEFINKYTNYVEEKYGRNEPEYDDCTTLVCATDDDIADSANKLVYTKESGVIEDAV